MIYDLLYRESFARKKAAAWIFSDLQQRDPELSRECFELCMADFAEMGFPADVIWYLGDAVEGRDLPRLREMAKMQEEGLEKRICPFASHLAITISNRSSPRTARPLNCLFTKRSAAIPAGIPSGT